MARSIQIGASAKDGPTWRSAFDLGAATPPTRQHNVWHLAPAHVGSILSKSIDYATNPPMALAESSSPAVYSSKMTCTLDHSVAHRHSSLIAEVALASGNGDGDQAEGMADTVVQGRVQTKPCVSAH